MLFPLRESVFFESWEFLQQFYKSLYYHTHPIAFLSKVKYINLYTLEEKRIFSLDTIRTKIALEILQNCNTICEQL